MRAPTAATRSARSRRRRPTAAIRTGAGPGPTISSPTSSRPPWRLLNFSRPYNSVRNFTAFGTKIASYNCPSDTPNIAFPPGDIKNPQTSYAGVKGLTENDTLLLGHRRGRAESGSLRRDRQRGDLRPVQQASRIVDVTDGLSNTAFVGEQSQFPNEPGGSYFNFNFVGGTFFGGMPQWANDARPEGMVYMVPKLNAPANTTNASNAMPAGGGPFGSTMYSFGNSVGWINDPTCINNLGQFGFRSLHPGGANFAFGDGSVKFIKNTTNLAIYRAIGTIDMGEIISSDAL